MPDTVRSAIDAWFDKHQEALVRDAGRLIAVKSVQSQTEPGMPYGRGPAAALALSCEILAERGFAPCNFENRVVTADLNTCEPFLGLLAHLDTVEAGDGWTTDPFVADVRGGRLYGRGASDDKGPAVAAIYALAAAREIVPAMKKGCRIILGSAEETGHDDLLHYRKKHKMPPNVFTPDAEYPVVNAEKGRLVPAFSASWPECASLPRVVSIKGGVTANAVPERAQALVEGLTVEQVTKYCDEYSEKTGAVIKAEAAGSLVTIIADGKAAHAMSPQDGLNAQTALLLMLSAMPMAECVGFSFFQKLAALFPHGDASGAPLGIAMSDEVFGPLTLNFGVLTVDMTGLRGNFDCRLPKCARLEMLEDVLTAKLNKSGFKIDDITKTAFHHTPEDSAFIQTLLKVYENYTGLKGDCLAIGGQTYVHDIDGGAAFGCVFPGTDTRMHGADEFIPINDLILSAKMFTQVIIDTCR